MGLVDLRKDTKFAAGILQKRLFQCLLQLTNRCNMRCPFCDFWPNGAPRREELSAEEYGRISEELAAMGTFLVSVEGGEPTLRPDLPRILQALARHHLPTLFTNGWYITRESAKQLFDTGLTHACVSIDYPEAGRHDRKRGLPGAFDRAVRALEYFLAAAPRPHRQVHIMSILMEDNWRDFPALLKLSGRLGVGHQVTLVSATGYRRGHSDGLPPPEAASLLLELWQRHPHLRFFGEYFRKMRGFLAGEREALPTCHAGEQSFNIDHVGNVSPCIEKIDQPLGNVRNEPLSLILARLEGHRPALAGCQDCWTACRGLVQSLGQGGSPGAWVDLVTRMRSS
jgi:MoaA/NifB/PqqE/SkfB family radical SAM enzyme